MGQLLAAEAARCGGAVLERLRRRGAMEGQWNEG